MHSWGKLAFALISTYSISNLNSVVFLQGNASKSIHYIESPSLWRRLKKKSLLCVLELRIEIMVPKLASKAALFTLRCWTGLQNSLWAPVRCCSCASCHQDCAVCSSSVVSCTWCCCHYCSELGRASPGELCRLDRFKMSGSKEIVWGC